MKAKKIEIENFRRFKGKQTFDLKGINILIGPNNSGKSTLIKALLLLKENLNNGWQEMEFGSENPHRILSFEHAVHHSANDKRFTVSFEVDSLSQTSYYDGRIQREDKLGHGAQLTYRKHSQRGTAVLDKVMINDQDNKVITTEVNGFHELFKDPGYFPVRDWIGALRYSPPYRSIGLKEYRKATFRNLGKSLKANKLLHDLGDRNELFAKWCSRFSLGEIEIQETPDAFVLHVSRDGHQIDLSFLGSGSAQVLGVLFLIAVSTEETIILEEPETNLHPNYQSQLADLIVDGSGRNYGNQFIVETHSEYLVRRFQYLVAKKEVDPNNIRIFYFDASADGGFTTLEIEPDGNLSGEFGPDFFDHAPYLITKLWEAQRN
jgi:predicted ATPase